jgi:hypothetical protein
METAALLGLNSYLAPLPSNRHRTNPGELRERPERTILSQAERNEIILSEGATTRAKARRAKRPEAPGPSKEGDDIVSPT